MIPALTHMHTHTTKSPKRVIMLIPLQWRKEGWLLKRLILFKPGLVRTHKAWLVLSCSSHVLRERLQLLRSFSISIDQLPGNKMLSKCINCIWTYSWVSVGSLAFMECLGSHESIPKRYLNLCSSLQRLSYNRRQSSVCHSHRVGFLYFHIFFYYHYPRGPHSNTNSSSHKPCLLQYTIQTCSLTLIWNNSLSRWIPFLSWFPWQPTGLFDVLLPPPWTLVC